MVDLHAEKPRTHRTQRTDTQFVKPNHEEPNTNMDKIVHLHKFILQATVVGALYF